MTEPFARLRRFLRELKRRNVYKVAVTSAAVVFVGLQAVRLLVPATTLPGWADELLIAIAVLGFPIAIVLAWAFEMTAEGMRRTPEDEGEATSSGVYQWIGLTLVVLMAGGVWYAAAASGGFSLARRATTVDTVAAPDSLTPRLGSRSVAVLPFEALGQQKPGPFTEGMHDALLTRLSNVSGLNVVSRTAVRQYRGTDETTGEIARELGVRWVLEGGVQEMGDQIQVNAQLIDPRTETHAWAEQYRRDLTAEKLFALQSEITKKIVRSLETQLTSAEERRVERRPTEDLEAYRLYVQGRSTLYQRTESGTRRALSYFRQAIEQDSSYALAWAGLADALVLRAQYGYRRPNEGSVRAAEAARRALALDSTLAEAHTSYGYAVAEGFDRIRAYRRALELKPSYSQAYHWLATEEVALGRLDSAVAHLERAVELDPTAAVLRGALANVYLVSGRGSAAVREIRRAVELAPSLGVAHLAEGWVLTEVGRHEEALAAFDRGFDLAPKGAGWRSVFEGWPGVAHARAGHRDQAEKTAASLAGGNDVGLKRGLIYLALGDTGRAASALQASDPGEWTWGHIGLFRYGSSLDPLRDSPEYEAALRRLNTSLGLRPDGSLPDSVDVPLGPPSR